MQEGIFDFMDFLGTGHLPGFRAVGERTRPNEKEQA
jgi:hypothetical protein